MRARMLNGEWEILALIHVSLGVGLPTTKRGKFLPFTGPPNGFLSFFFIFFVSIFVPLFWKRYNGNGKIQGKGRNFVHLRGQSLPLAPSYMQHPINGGSRQQRRLLRFLCALSYVPRPGRSSWNIPRTWFGIYAVATQNRWEFEDFK